MSYKIVIDSCGELLEQWKQDERFASVPLTLTVGSENIIDDETLTRQIFYRKLPPARNVRNQPARRQRATERHLTAKLNIYIALLFPLNSVVPITVQRLEQVFFMRRRKAFRFMFSIPVLLL